MPTRPRPAPRLRVWTATLSGGLALALAVVYATFGPPLAYRRDAAMIQTTRMDQVAKWTGGDRAAVRLTYPRAAGLDAMTIQDLDSAQATFLVMRTDLSPAALIPKRGRLTYRVIDGFRIAHPPELIIRIKGHLFSAEALRRDACRQTRTASAKGVTAGGLTAFDTLNGRGHGPGRRKIDGSYGSLRPVLPAPLNEADLFFAALADDHDAARIRCPYCAPT